jgi:hypothetical protein
VIIAAGEAGGIHEREPFARRTAAARSHLPSGSRGWISRAIGIHATLAEKIARISARLLAQLPFQPLHCAHHSSTRCRLAPPAKNLAGKGERS